MENRFIENIRKNKYDKCYLKTSEIKAKNNAFVSNELELSITVSDDQLINENWQIKIKGLSQYHNLIGISYKPYFKIEIENEHPLLWNYKYNLIETELSGIEKLKSVKHNSLIGELANLYANEIGNFVKFETNPISNSMKNSKGKRLFFSNQKLFGMIEPILLKYGITINNFKVKSGAEKGWANKPHAKVMLIRNPFISSKETIGSQTYIIADAFSFEMKNESITIDKK